MSAYRKEDPTRPLLLALVLALAGCAHVPVESAAVGECRFDFVWGAARFTGSRTCGPLGQESVSLLVPAALANWSDPRRPRS